MKIPVTKTVFDHLDRELLLKPLETGWLVQGPFVNEFEKNFCEFIPVQHACATTSCTTALHLALLATGIGKGDKVIVPSFTYVATANAVEYTGAEVIFCDIDLRTFNIDINDVKSLLEQDIEKKIKAILTVNLFGLCSDLPSLLDLTRQFNVKLIEDSACGLGAYIGDKHSGTFGSIGCFSFHPRKAITTGEGGMLITKDPEISQKARSLRDHGASKSDLQRHKEKGGSLLPDFAIKGYNYRMTDLQGALGVSQMKKVKDILQGRANIAQRYMQKLKNISGLIPPIVKPGYTHAYQSFVCLFAKDHDLADISFEEINKLNIQRNVFMRKLEKLGISVRQGTHAVHTLSYYKEKHRLRDKDFIRSFAADRLSVTLPLYATMTDEEFDYVIKNISELLK